MSFIISHVLGCADCPMHHEGAELLRCQHPARPAIIDPAHLADGVPPSCPLRVHGLQIVVEEPKSGGRTRQGSTPLPTRSGASSRVGQSEPSTGAYGSWFMVGAVGSPLQIPLYVEAEAGQHVQAAKKKARDTWFPSLHVREIWAVGRGRNMPRSVVAAGKSGPAFEGGEQ